jgi:hypothetical protein
MACALCRETYRGARPIIGEKVAEIKLLSFPQESYTKTFDTEERSKQRNEKRLQGTASPPAWAGLKNL